MNTTEIILFFDFSNKKQCTQSFRNFNVFSRYIYIYIYIYSCGKAVLNSVIEYKFFKYIYIYIENSVWRALRHNTRSHRESMRPLWFFNLYIHTHIFVWKSRGKFGNWIQILQKSLVHAFFYRLTYTLLWLTYRTPTPKRWTLDSVVDSKQLSPYCNWSPCFLSAIWDFLQKWLCLSFTTTKVSAN